VSYPLPYANLITITEIMLLGAKFYVGFSMICPDLLKMIVELSDRVNV